MPTEKPDRRGTPPGGATMPGKALVPGQNPGKIGNPPHVKTEALIEMVKTYGPVMTQEHLAAHMGISVDTLDRHYRAEIDRATANIVGMAASILVRKMLAGNMDALKFFLRTRGRWSTRLELTGKNGGPIQTRTFDLSGYTAEEKRMLLPLIDMMIAQGGPALEQLIEEGEFTEEGDGDGRGLPN